MKNMISKLMGPGLVLFLLIGGTNHYFTILFSYWFSITTIKNAIVSNQKNESGNPLLFLLVGGVLVIGRRDYYEILYTLHYICYIICYIMYIILYIIFIILYYVIYIYIYYIMLITYIIIIVNIVIIIYVYHISYHSTFIYLYSKMIYIYILLYILKNYSVFYYISY